MTTEAIRAALHRASYGATDSNVLAALDGITTQLELLERQVMTLTESTAKVFDASSSWVRHMEARMAQLDETHSAPAELPKGSGISAKGDEVEMIREALNHAAAAIVNTDPANWPGWIVYLMKALDDHAGHDFDNTLANVQTAIKDRKEAGRWPWFPLNVIAELTVRVPVDVRPSEPAASREDVNTYGDDFDF